MTDFWLSVLWTVLIAAVTVAVDWVAHRLVMYHDCFRAMRHVLNGNGTDAAKRAAAKAALDKLRSRLSESAGWGVDLVNIAIALDIACLGLSITNKMTLPFFERWNTAGADRSLMVWLVVLAGHTLCLVLSIVFRHGHAVRIGHIAPGQLVSVLQRGWIRQDRWAIAGKTVGLLSVLTAFAVVYDSVGI